MKRGIIIWLMIWFSITCFSQNLSRLIKVREIHYGAGTSTYFGEIPTKITTVQPSAEVGMNYFIKENLIFNAKFTLGRLKGDDALDGITDGRILHTTYVGVTGNIEIYLFNAISKFSQYRSYKGKSSPVNPYLSLGAGFINFYPNLTTDSETPLIKPDYMPLNIILPAGGGFRFKVGKFWSAGFNALYHFSLTDYLDDVKANNHVKKDKYFSTTLYVSYTMYARRHKYGHK